MTPIRERAKEILKVVPEPPKKIDSDGATAGVFTRLTGVTHATLWKDWEKGGIRTCCADFVGWYGVTLGSKEYLGRFDIEDHLQKISKGYSWVRSTRDARPKYGDICRHTAFHIGVSLDYDDGQWDHVDAGQGGPIRDKVTKELKGGHDVIKRTLGKPYVFTDLQGWIDLDLYFAENLPTPPWLTGWWKVIWRAEVFYYRFTANHAVIWTRKSPREFESLFSKASPSQQLNPPVYLVHDNGKYVVDGNTITIRWSATGSLEKFKKAAVDSMTGAWNDNEAITATKA